MRRLAVRVLLVVVPVLVAGMCTACGVSEGGYTLEDRFPFPGEVDDMDGRFPIPGWLPDGAVVAGTVVPVEPGVPFVASVAFGRPNGDGFAGAIIATVTETPVTSLPEGENIDIDGVAWIRTDDDGSVTLWRMAGAGPARIRAVTGDEAAARELARAIVLGTDATLQIGFAYIPDGLEIVGVAAAPPKRPVPTLTIGAPDGRATVTTRPHQAGTIAAESGEARQQRVRGTDGYLFPASAGRGLVWREPLVGSVTITGDLPPATLLRIAEGLSFGSRVDWETAITR